MTDFAQLELDLTNAIHAADTTAALEEVRVAALGKSGSVTALLKGMGALSPDERRVQGPLINGLRDRLTAALSDRKAALEAAELDARLAAETVDLSLPAPPRRKGSVHPTMQAMDEIVSIFAEMGFAVAEGPDTRWLGPVTAFDELPELELAGRKGWHTVGAAMLKHKMVRTPTQWEHRRVIWNRPTKSYETDGWTVAVRAFPWIYLIRDLGIPAEP